MYPEKIFLDCFNCCTWNYEKTALYFVGLCADFKDCVIYARDPENKNTFMRFSGDYIKNMEV